MEQVEIAEELRVSLAAFDEAQRKVREAEPRRLTHLLAVKPADDTKAVSSRRIYKFTAS